MFIFRLISFLLKIIYTLLIVFTLQIQFDGKTLESYIVDTGKKIMFFKILNQTSNDSLFFIRSLSYAPSKKNQLKKNVSNNLFEKIEDYKKRIDVSSPSKD